MSTSPNLELNEWGNAIQTIFYSALGGFDPEEVNRYPVALWLWFVLILFIMMVIMMNLLIAIVSDVFDRATAVS